MDDVRSGVMIVKMYGRRESFVGEESEMRKERNRDVEQTENEGCLSMQHVACDLEESER